ncbi:MAG: N-acetylneuraminate synthase family protein [Nocardioidaceae bacterium]|nr:N-acetylneuraminate synthase family protein [Nocardioidaceae bacterium]
MIVERDLAAYVVRDDEPVLRALEKITDNLARVVFVVDERGHLRGSLSDGDFRRWISAQGHADLGTTALSVANTGVRSALLSTPPAGIRALFGRGVDHVPLTDERGHLLAIAVDRSDAVRIGRTDVGVGSPALLVAEIGINHQGSVDLAKRLVDEAAGAGADVAKFQLRDMDALYRQAGGASAGEDLGPQYTLDLLARYNLAPDRLFEVFDHCREVGIEVMCTPWDPPSLTRLLEYGVPALKIASADLTNHDLLGRAAASGTPLVISTGMATEAEIVESVELVRASGAGFALLHCQSTYPAPFKDVNLAYLRRLAEIGRCPVGYSGHERGFHVPIAAVALGAKIIEKHLTVDRGLEGNDHKVSLLPGELAEMVARIREVEAALGTAEPRRVSTGEQMNRINLAKSLVAARPVSAGATITADDVAIRSPGRGLQPNARDRLVGRTATRSLQPGDFFYAADLADRTPTGRSYRFRRPWGVPVRFHDVAAMTRDARPDFLEFHFSYKDLEADLAAVLDEQPRIGFTTHSPDLFSGDFLLNLASDDDAHWERSIAELQRVVDVTRAMRPWFPGQVEDPVVVASLGGFTSDAHVTPDRLDAMYDRVAAGLARIDETGVRLCAQTLPPYPWYMGGQLFCNLFVGPADTAAFAERHGRRLCLDVSHSRLAASFLGMPFTEAVDLLAPYAEHLHLVDAVGVDGEGVQVGEGEVDWPVLAEQLDRLAPGASFIPEIWQGHVNDGEGFWLALERLEEWF